MHFRAQRVSLLCPPSTTFLPLSLIKQSFRKHGALLSTRAGNEVWFLPQRDLKPSEGNRARKNPAPHCAHRYRLPCGATQDESVAGTQEEPRGPWGILYCPEGSAKPSTVNKRPSLGHERVLGIHPRNLWGRAQELKVW